MELAARKQRRTVSSFIEWAVEQALPLVMLPGDASSGPIDLAHASVILWDPDEADRLAKLGLYYPDLLTYDEQVLWKRIQECEALWLVDFNQLRGLPPQEQDTKLCYPALRLHWEWLKKMAAGEDDMSILLEPEDPRKTASPDLMITRQSCGQQ
jgi:hypothetical protein